MPGFPVNRFSNLSEREKTLLICGVCLTIFNDPIKTECEHTFCKSCLRDCIEGLHKACPECRQKFSTRKRTAQMKDDPNIVILNNYFFKRNLMANSFVDKLETKCDFESNGCKEVIEFGSLSAHLKECVHRLCPKCGFTLGRDKDHNCVHLLVNEKNRLKQQLTDQISVHKRVVTSFDGIKKELEVKNSKLEELLVSINSNHEMKSIELKSKYDCLLETNKQLSGQISKQESLLNSNEELKKNLKEKNSKLEFDFKRVVSQQIIQEKTINDQKFEYETILKTNKELENQLSEETKSCLLLKSEFKELTQNYSSLQTQLNVIQKERIVLRDNEITDKYSKLEKELESKEKTINEWKEKYENQLKPNDTNLEEDINSFMSLMTQFERPDDSNDIKIIKVVTQQRRRSSLRLHKDLEILDKNYRFEEQLKKNNQIIENKNQLIESQRNELQYYLNGLIIMSQRSRQSIELIRFGTFNTIAERVMMSPDCIKVLSVTSNSGDVVIPCDLSLPFDLINDIQCFNDSHLSALFIKMKGNDCQYIKDDLYLGDNSPNGYNFEANSNDPKLSYIVIGFGADAHIYHFFIRYLKLVDPPISVRPYGSPLKKDIKTDIKTDINTDLKADIKTDLMTKFKTEPQI